MSSPVGSTKATSSGIHQDPAVDYRHEVGIRNQIQNSPGPWAVHATEQDVTVNGALKAGRLADTVLVGIEACFVRGC